MSRDNERSLQAISEIGEIAYNKAYQTIDYSSLRNMSVYSFVDDAIAEFLSDDKIKEKLVNMTLKKITDEAKKREKALKAEDAKNLKLWKASKGKIPCLNECGYYDFRNKDDILNGSNNFICADCVKMLEEKNISTFSLFGTKNVYKLFGIEE
jgi:hypothetical protein